MMVQSDMPSGTVLQVPFGYFPDPCGGTEVYVRGLSAELAGMDVPSVVAAPGSTHDRYVIDQSPVWRWPADDAGGFERILDEVKPSLVHFHALSPAVGAEAARASKARGARVVWTYHTPTLSCASGTMMRWGHTPCDGEFRTLRCTACAAHAKSGSHLVAGLLGIMPASWSALAREQVTGRLGTALGFKSAQLARDRQFRDAMALADRVVAVCAWVRDALLVNGIPEPRIVLNRQGVSALKPGVPATLAASAAARAPSRASPIRLAFFGRVHPTKGLDLLVSALQRLPEAALELNIHGVVLPDSDRAIRDLQSMIARDSRVIMRPPVPADAVIETMRGYDLIAVPSRWLESGPLVVLEAFAAGVPVLGSRLGGIAELVRDGVDGMLVEALSVEAWTRALERVLAEPGKLEAMKRSIRPPRTMADVAHDMRSLYRELLDGRTGRRPEAADHG